ncbi:MAG: hypothetical protein ACREXR_04500 [Gammaproteobacteria bacterium]
MAKLVGKQTQARQPRLPGSSKGKLVIIAEDDEHLAGWRYVKTWYPASKRMGVVEPVRV